MSDGSDECTVPLGDVLLTIYVIGGIIWFIVNMVNRNVPMNHSEYISASRNVLATPIWPIVGAAWLIREIREIIRDLAEHDRENS